MNDFVATINGRKHSIRVFEDGKVQIDGKTITTEITKVSTSAYIFRYGKNIFEIATNKISGDKYSFSICGWYFETVVRTVLQETADEMKLKRIHTDSVYEIKAPMPGLVLKINKKVGDSVSSNEAILLLEAMKMENELRSPRDGIVKKIFYAEGQSVEKDSIILTIE